MASNSSRTISLTLNANTTGSETVKALADEMKQLAKAGGDAAPEAEKLAKELDTLAKQQNAVENLHALSRAADDTKVALSKAETEVKASATALGTLKQELDTASAAESAHAAQIKAAQITRAEAKASYEAARTALAQYTAEIGGAKSANAAEKTTLDEKRAVLRQLKAAYEESKSKVSALVPEMIRLKDAVTPLAVEYSKQQREMNALTKESESAKQATLDLANATKQAETAAQALGVDTSKLAGEENRLAQSMAHLTQESGSLRAGLEAATASSRDLLEEQRQSAISAQKAAEYTNFWVNALNKLDADQKAAQVAKLDEQQRQTAISAQKAAEYTNFWVSALNKADQALANSKSKIEATKNAFDVLGLSAPKEVETIRAKLLDMNQALLVLAKNSDVTEAQMRQAMANVAAETKKLDNALKSAEGAAKSFGAGITDAFKQFGPATLVFNGVTSAIHAMTSAASRIPKVTAEFQTMSRVLEVLTGSQQAAAKEFEYIKGVANRVGADIKGVGESYIRLTAATKDTNLEGAQTKRIFEAVYGAMGMLGASSAETEHAIMAVSQMVSKGVVSMEEMRQQLGERLPGAFQVTAKQLGITTADLNDFISSGKATADQILPALAKGLEEVYKSGSPNDTLIGKWRQFTNALKEAAAAFGNTGAIDNLLTGLRVITAGFQGFFEYLHLGIRQTAILFGALIQGDFKTAMQMIREEFDAANHRIAKTSGLAGATQKSLGDLAKEAKEAGQDFVTMSDGTKIATAALLDTNSGMVAFQIESAKSEARAETLATINRKLAESTRASGEAATTAANALGDESDKRRVAIQVAGDNAAALEKLLVSEKAVLAVMEARVLKMVEEVAAKGKASDTDQKLLADLDQELQKRKGVVDGLQQQVEANYLLKSSLIVQAEAFKDNSENLDALRAQYIDVGTAVADLRVQVLLGTATQKELTAAEQEAMRIKALYKDALEDQGKKIEALNAKKQAQINLETSTIRLAIEQQKTIYEVAKARGEESKAAQAMLKIKDLEIQLSELTAKAKKAEALAALEKIKLDREELKSKGALTEAAALELQAREAAAGVKMKEAEIATELAKRMRELVKANNASGSSADSASGGYERLADSMNTAADAARNLNAAQRGGGENGGGIPGSSSNGINGVAGTAKSILDDPDVRKRRAPVDIATEMYKRGATIDEVKAAQKYYGELYDRNAATMLTGNLGNGQNAARQQNIAMTNAMDQAIKFARQELATGRAVDLGTSIRDIEARNLATTKARSEVDQMDAIKRAGNEARNQPTVMHINIGGKQTKVNVGSMHDANQLANVLKALEQQAGVSA